MLYVLIDKLPVDIQIYLTLILEKIISHLKNVRLVIVK